MLMLIWVILRLTDNKSENSSYHLWLWQLLLFTTYSVLLITSLTFQLLIVTHYSLLKVHHSSLKAHHSVPSMLLSVINIFFILFSFILFQICFTCSKSILIVNCFRRAFLYTHATADTFCMIRMLCDIHVHLAGSLTFAAGYTFILTHLHLQKRYLIAKRIDCAQRTYPFTEWAVKQNT